jgi:hypothetical protein
MQLSAGGHHSSIVITLHHLSHPAGLTELLMPSIQHSMQLPVSVAVY